MALLTNANNNNLINVQMLQVENPGSYRLSPLQQGAGDSSSGSATWGSVGTDSASGSTTSSVVTRRNVFVAGLAPCINDREFESMFHPFGKILSAKVMLDIHSGISRGFGFVLFEEEVAATRAIEVMEGQLVHSSRLHLSYSNHRGENLTVTSSKVYVRNVPALLTDAELVEHFSQYGELVLLQSRTDMHQSPVGASPKTKVVFIEFETAEAAREAVSRTHGTSPFPQCIVPLLAKVAEPYDLRSERLRSLQATRAKVVPPQPCQQAASPSMPQQHPYQASAQAGAPIAVPQMAVPLYAPAWGIPAGSVPSGAIPLLYGTQPAGAGATPIMLIPVSSLPTMPMESAHPGMAPAIAIANGSMVPFANQQQQQPSAPSSQIHRSGSDASAPSVNGPVVYKVQSAPPMSMPFFATDVAWS